MSGVQVPAGASDSSAVVLAPPQQQHLQEVTVVTQFSPEAADGINEVVLAPPQQQQKQGQEVTVTQFSPEAVDEIIRRYKASPRSETDDLEYMQGWLMMLATLTASITYSAALNPPGGFWQGSDAKDDKGRVPGNPVLRDINPDRYMYFIIFNVTSFVSSMNIIAFLKLPNIFKVSQLKACNTFVSVDLISLMMAFTTGYARSNMDYVYVFAFLVGMYVGFMVAGKIWQVLAALVKCIRSNVSQ